MSKNKVVFIIGAGFSKAMGACTVNNKSFASPLDKDFFKVLKDQGILKNLLSDKPCLTLILDWMNIYDRNTDELKQINFSLESFWTNIDLMRKINSSISGFPQFNLPIPNAIFVQNSIPNTDSLRSQMFPEEAKLYEYLSDTTVGNFFNPEGLTLYLADYELKKLIFDIYSTLKYQHKDANLVDKFKEIVGESPIINFNYDCLIESILSEYDIVCYDNHRDLNNNNKLIIKPHGSLGWEVIKRYSKDIEGKKGLVEIQNRIIDKKVLNPTFTNTRINNDKLDSSLPIIIPMSSGKENIVAGLDGKRIKLCPDNEENKKREFIDCVVSYAKMFEVIKDAKRLIFIGYSFPQMDYETTALLNLATKDSVDRECHICIKDTVVPQCKILCNKLAYYKEGVENFLEVFEQ